ncbi:alpha/beta fold hydrolase [Streptomyces sp. Je 1-332]|uniref:thioesterase II family protein n=1 Tax=Streptomyces sp. Je 1-332 TaxID=3231270 RepID=UPI00345B4374
MESRWLRRFTQTSDAELRLVCFPHAGGAATAYVPLSRALAPAVDVLAVQYPGRQERRLEAPAASLTSLAESVADELMTAMGTGVPYAFFGHSMGAAIAYETALRIEELGGTMPVRLFLSGRGAPTPAPRGSDLVHDDAELIEKIRSLGGTATGVLDEPDLLEMVLPALRADYGILGGYHWSPRPPLDTPFTVLVGDADPVVATADARAWLEHSTAQGEFHVLPGGHFYLDSRTAAVAEVIGAALRRVKSPSLPAR